MKRTTSWEPGVSQLSGLHQGWPAVCSGRSEGSPRAAPGAAVPASSQVGLHLPASLLLSVPCQLIYALLPLCTCYGTTVPAPHRCSCPTTPTLPSASAQVSFQSLSLGCLPNSLLISQFNAHNSGHLPTPTQVSCPRLLPEWAARFSGHTPI